MLERIRKNWQKQSKHRNQLTASEVNEDKTDRTGEGTSEVVEAAEVYHHIASFFPSSRNFEISGGQFNSYPNQQTTGNVIITVNQSGNRLSGEVSQGTPAEDAVHRINPRSLQQESRLDSPLPLQKSSEIYYRHLLIAGRGSPLWIPEPSNTLPIEYQRKGISIGDVGILTDSGAFDFLFNIYLPKGSLGNPINPEELPEEFSPFNSPRPRDISSHMEYKNGSFLAGSLVKTRRDGEGPGLIFESSASEGAILAMPNGGNSRDLKNTIPIEKYARANAEKWYKYANSELCGRKVKNGDLRLVLGHTSTTGWGMAAFVNRSEQNGLNFLKFKATSLSTYGWEYSGKAEVKSGPDRHEIETLRNLDRMAGEEGSTSYENQCLFVRTMNVTLQDEVWDRLSGEWGMLDLGDDTGGFSLPNQDLRPSFNQPDSSSSGSASNSGMGGMSSSRTSRPVDGLTPTHEHSGSSVHLSDLPSVLNLHPSKVINQFLLKEKPDAKMAVTSDNDWIAVLEKSDRIFPDSETFIKRITSTFDICDSEGVVFLQPKVYRYPVLQAVKNLLQSNFAFQVVSSRAIPDLDSTPWSAICGALHAPSFSRFGWLGIFPLFNGPDFYLSYVESLISTLPNDDNGWKHTFTFWMRLHLSNYVVYGSLMSSLNCSVLCYQTTDERSAPDRFIFISTYISLIAVWLGILLRQERALKMWFDLDNPTPKLDAGAWAVIYSLPYVFTLWSIMFFGVAVIRLLLKDFYYATPVAMVWITVHTLWIFSKATPTYVEENPLVRLVQRLISGGKKRSKTTSRERITTAPIGGDQQQVMNDIASYQMIGGQATRF